MLALGSNGREGESSLPGADAGPECNFLHAERIRNRVKRIRKYAKRIHNNVKRIQEQVERILKTGTVTTEASVDPRPSH